MTRRLRRGWSGCRPEGAVLSFEAKESTKESQRHGDSRGGGPPRCALFANIGVPGTAVPGSCICSGLPVANCLRQLCPLGTRSLSAQASVCGSRTVGRPEFIRGVQFRPLGRNSLTTFRGQTALRGCPRARGVRCRIAPYRSLCSPPTLPAGRFGLRPRPHWGHASLRDSSLRSPAGKRLLLPILTAGLAMSRAMELDSVHQRLERARARLFPPSKWAGLFPSAAYRRSALPQLALGRLKWRCLGCLDADCVASQHRKRA